MLPDDAFWAAKQVAAFTDEEIRALVRSGRLSDPRAEQWIAECLMRRRDKIVRAFVPRLLPVDRFRVEQGRLEFDIIGEGIVEPPRHTVRWLRGRSGKPARDIPGSFGTKLPLGYEQLAADELLVAHIYSSDARAVRVYIRLQPDTAQVVGIERTWAKPADVERSSRMSAAARTR